MKAMLEAIVFGMLAVAAHVALGLKLAGGIEPRTGPEPIVLTLRAVPQEVTRHVAEWERQPAALQSVFVPPDPAPNFGEVPVLPRPVSAPAAFLPPEIVAGARETDAPPADVAPLPLRPRPLMLAVRRAASVPAPPPSPPRGRRDRPDRGSDPPRLPMPETVAVPTPGARP
jgi:hypothetical protein